MKTKSSPFLLVLCYVAAGLSAAMGQDAPKEQTFDLAQPGSQTVALGKLPFQGQRAGHIKGTLFIERGGLTGTLVLRMLSGDGTDLATRLKLGGFNDPTREIELKGLKPGAPIPISADFVSAAGTAAVSVELKANVTTAPCAVRIEGLAIGARVGGTAVADTSGQAGRLAVKPEADFPYARNLVPALDSSRWRATGKGAQRGKGAAGQAVLVLDENSGGKWESPVTPLEAGAKTLCFQAFVKFDALATPLEHPFQILFRDARGNILPTPDFRKHWPWDGWTHAHGQWLPVGMALAVPDQAVSVQCVVSTGEVARQAWHTGDGQPKNNFIAFQMAGVRLWAETKAAPAAFVPFAMTAWAGGVAGPGPFTPCAPQQENSIVLTTRVNDTDNLHFSKEGKWPSPRVWVENQLPIRRTVELSGEVFDWAGNALGKVSSAVDLEPFQNKDVELPVAPIKRTGIFSINLDATQEGATVGQGVIRWGCFKAPSDRADRLDAQYPFFFHPLFNADGGGYLDAPRLGQETRTLRALGVRGVRLQCRLWSFDAAKPNESVAAATALGDNFRKQVWPTMQRHGLEAFVSFFPMPRSPIPASEAELAAWKQYVAAAVRTYPEFSTFVFGNEEIGSFNTDLDVKALNWGYLGSMRDYMRQFLSARQAALEARPEVVFIPGEASDPLSNVARLFFEAGGTAQDVQGWALNSYGDASPTWKRLSTTLERNGVNLANAVGVIPEIGINVPRRGPTRLAGEKSAAVALVISHVETLATAPWIRYFTWFATAFYGVENHGIFDGDWSPKPSAGAYLTMTAALGAGRPTRVAELPGVSAYLWRRPDGSKAGVIWAPGRQRLRLQVGETPGPVIVRDIMGNDTPLVPEAGVVTAEVSDSPVYLLNIQALEDGSETSADWTLEKSADGARQARVEIRNRSGKPLKIEGRFEGPPEIAWSHPDITGLSLEPGESKVLTQRFRLMEEDFADTTTLTLMLKANGGSSASDFASSLLMARRTAAPPSLGADGQSWELADTAVLRELRHVTGQAGPIRWSGPDDLSARCRLLWDERNLYFQAEVKDDVHVQETAPGRMFLNDNIQLAFMADGPGKDSAVTELSLGLGDGREAVYGHVGQKIGVVDAKTAQLSVTRDEAARTTVYEAAIAWQALGIAEPKPGLHLRFAILVNDSDRKGSAGKDRQAIQWFSGIFHKDPSRFGDVTLGD